jgi:hypothetical protein
MGTEVYQTLVTGYLKRAVLMEMCRWLFEARQSASQNMTVTGFKSTSISKNMDRSEEYFLWHLPSKESFEDDLADNVYFD